MGSFLLDYVQFQCFQGARDLNDFKIQILFSKLRQFSVQTDYFQDDRRYSPDSKCILDKVNIAANSSDCAWLWNVHNIERTKRNYSHRRLSYRHFTFSYLGCRTKRTVYLLNKTFLLKK